MTETDTFGERLRLARRSVQWSQDELASRSGVGVATIRRAEGDKFDPRLETARRLAEALSIRLEWLLTGDHTMISQSQMTSEEQHRMHNGPGSENAPGYVMLEPGPWFRVGNEWRHAQESDKS